MQSQFPSPRMQHQPHSSAVARHAAVFCSFLFALGFPGKLVNMIGGERMSMLIQYAIFALQIVFMLITSGDNLLDMKIIDLKKEFTVIYLMLGVFFILSMLVTHDRPAQFISCLRFTVTGLFALWIVHWYDVKHILKFACRAQSIIVLLSLALMLIPSMGWTTMDGARCFVGIFAVKNVCGAEIGFGLTLYVALLRLYWKDGEQPSLFFYFILLCQLIMLFLSRAMGSLVTALISIAVLLLFHENSLILRRLSLGWLYVIGSVGFLVFALYLIPPMGPFLEAIGKDATLTGRIPMWRQHIDNMLSSHTLTGYGFCMFWKNPTAVEAFHIGFDDNSWASSMTTGAHNELVELWLDMGLIGIGVFFFTLIVSFRRVKAIQEDAYAFSLAVMLSVFIKGLTERTHSPASYWTLFLFLACALALKSKAQPPTEPLRG